MLIDQSGNALRSEDTTPEEPQQEKETPRELRPFDWKNPDYVIIFRKRIAALARIRFATKKNPNDLKLLKAYYRDHIAQFIIDWGVTIDPRNVERNLPAMIPFMLFPKQIEWVEWVISHWRSQRPGLTEKTRDMGMSWLAVAVSCSLCLFYDGMQIGFGSRKEEYVDKIDSPKSLFHKARVFMSLLPVEFRGGWREDRDAPHMRLNFPQSGSNISGEAGDNVGRGDRTGIYFIDESAHLEHPALIDASLAATTNCRIDISSANGPANSFALKRHSGKIDVFTFHWRDDPRKDDSWYERQKNDLDAVTLAQEVDINYNASVEGQLIPHEWALAAIDAHIKLKITPSGARTASLDVADEGPDLNALCGAHGILVEHLEEWSGKGADIYATTQQAFDHCDALSYTKLRYDSDGLGVGVRGDARKINEDRLKRKIRVLPVEAFHGSGAVVDPDKPVDPGTKDTQARTNDDFFKNLKAQSWWRLRTRFKNTFQAVTQGKEFDADEIISISSTLPMRNKLLTELAQVTYALNTIGKMLINKTPDGSRSPNLADAVMIQFSKAAPAPMRINPALLNRA